MAVILFSGCGNTRGTDDNKNGHSIIEESFDKITQAIESGKSMKCNVTVSLNDSPQSMVMNYWIKGKNMLMESTMRGEWQVVIVKDDVVYTKIDNMLGGASDCVWMRTSAEKQYDSGNGDAEDVNYDYKQFENDPNYAIKCKKDSFGEDKFEVIGKVCTMQEMVGNMVPGMNLDGLNLGI